MEIKSKYVKLSMFICSIFHFISSDISIPPKTMITIKDNISITPEFPRMVR